MNKKDRDGNTALHRAAKVHISIYISQSSIITIQRIEMKNPTIFAIQSPYSTVDEGSQCHGKEVMLLKFLKLMLYFSPEKK